MVCNAYCLHIDNYQIRFLIHFGSIVGVLGLCMCVLMGIIVKFSHILIGYVRDMCAVENV